uniref:T-cell receptor alpha/delta variable 14.0 n=1 Tax=Paramormyrops kingsleyae TaxID=1676925 RepID=A0A3B3Q3B5_9TELE
MFLWYDSFCSFFLKSFRFLCNVTNHINSVFLRLQSHSTEDVITPFNDTVHVTEGDNVTLSCNYSGLADSLLWYRQYPRSAPEFLLLILESTGSVPYPKLRMSPKVDKKNKRVDLELSSTEVTDSAVYYCALRPTVTGNSLTLYKNLTAA